MDLTTRGALGGSRPSRARSRSLSQAAGAVSRAGHQEGGFWEAAGCCGVVNGLGGGLYVGARDERDDGAAKAATSHAGAEFAGRGESGVEFRSGDFVQVAQGNVAFAHEAAELCRVERVERGGGGQGAVGFVHHVSHAAAVEFSLLGVDGRGEGDGIRDVADGAAGGSLDGVDDAAAGGLLTVGKRVRRLGVRDEQHHVLGLDIEGHALDGTGGKVQEEGLAALTEEAGVLV